MEPELLALPEEFRAGWRLSLRRCGCADGLAALRLLLEAAIGAQTACGDSHSRSICDQVHARDLRRSRPSRATRMVARKRPRRLRRRHDRRQPDQALPRPVDRADRLAARTPPHSCQGRCHRDRGPPVLAAVHEPLAEWRHLAGHVRIGSFELDYSTPVWTYEIGEHRIEARIWLEPGSHTTYVAWWLRPPPEAPEHALSLRVTLLANHRDHHGTSPVWSCGPEIAVRGAARLVPHA